ncbi:MAG: hypothetical protein IJW70_02705 [Clostridia bacterium]|nr:hypothetical protein [Clostridia bacterium]
MNGRRLYDEIGGVNERYLQEAATYRVRRKTPAWRTLLIAAALILVGALVLGTVSASTGIILLGRLLDNNQSEAPDAPDVNQPVQNYTLANMEQTLAHKAENMLPTGADAIKLFDGQARLIWTDGESDAYYSVTLYGEELGNILYLMQAQQVDIDEDSEQPSYKVWICFGDGTVISPYLKNDAGNTGHGELFDYDPELELSEDLIGLIMRCVET